MTAEKWIRTGVIAAGTLMFLWGGYLSGGLYPLDLADTRGALFDNWHLGALIRDAGAMLAAAAVIIGGLRNLRSQGKSFGRISFCCLGAGIVVFFVSLHAVAYFQSTRILSSYDFGDLSAHIEKLMHRKDLPDAKRKVLTKKLAESRYLQSGERMRLTEPGRPAETFTPSKELLRFKQQSDQSRDLLNWIKGYSFRSIVTWLALLIASSAFGAFSPLKRQSAQASRT